jgi:hypothetical protein
MPKQSKKKAKGGVENKNPTPSSPPVDCSQCARCKALREGRDPNQETKAIFERSFQAGVPIVTPIVGGEHDCAFTIGMTRLAPTCGGELVVSLLPPRMAGAVLTSLSRAITAGTIHPETDWKEGTELQPHVGPMKEVSISCALRIHVMSDSDVGTFLNGSRDAIYNLSRSTKAYQILWADKHGQFPDALLHAQKKPFETK